MEPMGYAEFDGCKSVAVARRRNGPVNVWRNGTNVSEMIQRITRGDGPPPPPSHDPSRRPDLGGGDFAPEPSLVTDRRPSYSWFGTGRSSNPGGGASPIRNE